MRTGIENWLVDHWYSNRPPPWYLRLLEPVYRAGYQRAQVRGAGGAGLYRSKLPLVVVGNITAGGSGKTPLVIRLCQLALEMNLKPGIASTGYGRQGTDTYIVNGDSDTRVCGDEPVLLAQRTGVPVVVAADRLEAVKKLNEMDLDLVFSDDGLQTAGMCRDIEFCVVDGERGLGNGHLLPAGPLRESAERLQRVDYVVSNGQWTAQPAGLSAIAMLLQATVVRSLDGNNELTVDQFRHRYSSTKVHAVAAIGHPQRFFGMLKTLSINAESHGFADHHTYARGDFSTMEGDSVIIMTEKDAVKCRSLGLENAWYVPVETLLPAAFESLFKERLAQLIKDKA